MHNLPAIYSGGGITSPAIYHGEVGGWCQWSVCPGMLSIICGKPKRLAPHVYDAGAASEGAGAGGGGAASAAAGLLRSQGSQAITRATAMPDISAPKRKVAVELA